ncbi:MULTISPECIES: polysaccharide deacetylase family protein [unclassified Helicobacter]|uniref:polysaccharide deacetylase family protein n=1 Tax=unclassified Helicobacter TaxID=2593540 RepID=UPI000CF10F56|nr:MULTISPECIES: polysaccharide deacetylase family protein [unclassified Helicobacter]
MATRLLFFSLIFLNFLQAVELKSIKEKYRDKTPVFWGYEHQGIISKIKTNKPIIFLTLDACSGEYDKRIIDLLQKEKIPAILFVNTRWIENHQLALQEIAKNPLFSIQNHGNSHKPLSIEGKSAYQIEGTKNIQEVYEEIILSDELITHLTGKKPTLFRSGTAYYDDVAIAIAKDLGYKIIGFDVIGDGGATFDKEQILLQAQKVTNGSILIYHFNHPQKDTYEGLKSVIKILKEKGFLFKSLIDYL